MGILAAHNPSGNPQWDKKEIKKETKLLLQEIKNYTNLLYAERKQSVLLVLQGMDASGKDGLTRNLFEGISPTWVNAYSFKKPSDEELEHDYMWRIHQKTPKKGMITVFNRSYYEDILVPSVYGLVDQNKIDERYDQINQFEKYLEANGTRVVKCFLNLSYETQELKLNERINLPEKHWKHNDLDWETREKWTEFMSVYEGLFSKCNDIPWHFLPADKNWTKLYVAAKLLLKTLKEMNPQFPDLISNRFISPVKK